MAEPRELMRTLSWHVEKLFRKRGNLYGVLWLTLAADGKRQLHEGLCGDAPRDVSDEQLLAELAAGLKDDFRAGGVTAFAIAYAANRVTVSWPVEQTLLLQPVSERVPVIVLEAHSAEAHWRAEREVLESRSRQRVLAALSPVAEAADSIYGSLLTGA